MKFGLPQEACLFQITSSIHITLEISLNFRWAFTELHQTLFINTLPTPAGAGHQWTENTINGCNQWLSLAKIALKVPPACRNRSLAAITNMCGEDIKYGMQYPDPIRLLPLKGNLFTKMPLSYDMR